MLAETRLPEPEDLPVYFSLVVALEDRNPNDAKPPLILCEGSLGVSGGTMRAFWALNVSSRSDDSSEDGSRSLY